jgi:ABC-type nitrate/sulfonate/bicarbonate transport system permease component
VITAAGFSITAGFMLARAMRAEPTLRAYLVPLVCALGAIPAAAWIAPAHVWFGIGFFPAIFAGSVGAVFPVLLQMMPSLKGDVQASVEPLGKPDPLPAIIAAIRFAFMTVLVVELTGSANGLGYVIANAAAVLDTASLLAVVFTVGLLGWALEYLATTIIRLKARLQLS